jgi:hypothetical protein
MYPPQFSPAFSYEATSLRALLLKGYDRVVPPVSHRVIDVAAEGFIGVGNYSAAGTDVILELRFYKLESLSTADASLRVHVWMRHRWNDTRLAWDPSQHGNLTELTFR